MFNSLIINVAVGLIFTFGVFALLTSTLTEAIARYLGLRGDFLLRGLRALVDGKSVKAASPAARADVPVPPGQDPPEPTSARLLSTMLLANQGQESILQNTMDGVKGLAARRRLPSYLPARSFSAAVLDLLIPNNATGTTNLATLVASINQLPAGPFRGSLVALAKDASDDVDRFRSNIEHWYDDHMDRVSGWYKRHIRWISIAIGTLLVLSLNVNAISITRTLYTDQALNESIVTQAVAHTQCDPNKAGDCIADAQKQIANLRSDGLPFGWGVIPQCQAPAANCVGPSKYGLANPDHNGSADFWYVLALVAGWIITALALTPGARFWFDLLSRLGSLRSSGPKAAKT